MHNELVNRLINLLGDTLLMGKIVLTNSASQSKWISSANEGQAALVPLSFAPCDMRLRSFSLHLPNDLALMHEGMISSQGELMRVPVDFLPPLEVSINFAAFAFGLESRPA